MITKINYVTPVYADTHVEYTVSEPFEVDGVRYEGRQDGVWSAQLLGSKPRVGMLAYNGNFRITKVVDRTQNIENTLDKQGNRYEFYELSFEYTLNGQEMQDDVMAVRV